MKNQLVTGLLIIGILPGCTFLKKFSNNNGGSKPYSINVDSLANARADSIMKAKLGNSEMSASFNRPIDNNIYLPGENYKDEVYVLPGMILMLYKDSGKIRIEETGFSVKKKDAKLDIEIKFDKPFFNSIIEHGFSTNIDVMKQLSLNLDDSSKLAVQYKTIQVEILETEGIDILKADSVIDNYLKVKYINDSSVIGYFIVRSVNLNNFSYTRFTKLEGEAKANGMAFQSGANIFYKIGDEQNSFEVVLKGITRKETYNKMKISSVPGLKIRADEFSTMPEKEWVELRSNEIITK